MAGGRNGRQGGRQRQGPQCALPGRCKPLGGWQPGPSSSPLSSSFSILSRLRVLAARDNRVIKCSKSIKCRHTEARGCFCSILFFFSFFSFSLLMSTEVFDINMHELAPTLCWVLWGNTEMNKPWPLPLKSMHTSGEDGRELKH